MRSLTSEAAHFSDHRMVTVTLDWEGLVKIGRGSWRMNTSVLEDQTVRRSFSRRYLEWRTLKELYDSPIECLLQREGFEVARELSETKEHLATLYREEQKKSQFRSKLQGLEEDEKCTRYFFRKARSRQKPILSLYNSQGDSVKNSADILRAAGDFYGRLYDTKPADGDLATAFLEGLNRVIEGGESEDPEMSIEELTRAVHSINKQKAPGPDGIQGEFYQTFWDLIKNDVAEVFQAIYRERRLGESMRQSTINLIPKKGDLKDLRNWRPINLLSVAYKIMTKALTKRFQSHLPRVIAADQTCSIPERSINDNLLLVRDVILHSQERGSPLGLLSLDQEKAFDRVSHGFLQRVLKKMNFPQHLINWTNLCYQNISSRVLVNNILTDPFPIRSGVRQGCPLAPLLYVIYLEPFLERIRTSTVIPGYQLPGAGGERLRVMAYMDDITIVGTDSRSITTATKAVDDYCAAPGALVNRAGRGGSTSWAETICRVQRKICEWSARSLTMTGKTLILKAIVLPILLYLGRVFPPDKAASKKIERLMFTFVWGSQMERLQRSTLYKMVENGGKGVPDILNIIRAQQLSNLVKTFNKPDRKGSFFERHYATPILRTLGMGTIDHTVPYSWDPPKVYKAIRDFAFGSGLQLGWRLGNTKTSWATSAPRTQWSL
ncbi:hypothetical protein DPEC_G00204510 [Dallia pectoralis]|uniref:Uncharacterized protein n=1 Tax=Dallia pectoralis TaxID=75939 RepID=A0ACC2G9W2_DALPE|nr:hypothetical protein DPEC_G00204510 [Dallia pectoralis]